MRDQDVIIAGAGASGLTSALALAEGGRRVAVVGHIERSAPGRTVALFDGSLRFMRALGLGGWLDASGAPLEVMRIIDDTDSLFRQPQVDFRAAEIGLPAFGLNVENTALVAELADRVRAHPAITLHEDLIESFTTEPESVRVRLASGGELEAPLLVAADGRASPTRTRAGIRTRVHPWPQTALTLVLAHTRPHRNVSTEFHTRAGPCTLVPLPGRAGSPHRSSLVWMMKPRDAERRRALPDEALAREIERQTHHILGSLRIEGPRGAYPMSTMRVGSVTAPRLALVGDAAHGFPPIGAQGLNLGLRDIADLTAALEGAADPGAASVLADYAAQRRGDIAWRTLGVDQLNGVLLESLPMADMARGAGLLALSTIGPLRRFVMRLGIEPRRRVVAGARPRSA